MERLKAATKKSCPICKKAAAKEKNPHWPFCSERCKKIDLGKWALEEYRIPGEKVRKEKEEEDVD